MAPGLDRHVVTAVLVMHDGARWLPETLKALLSQTRRIQRLVIADTGSTDTGPAIVAGVVGPGNLLTLDRDVPFAAAVAAALKTPAAAMEVDAADAVEWVWILHDDSTPAPTALENLLLQADADPNVALAGPKLRDWDDRRLLLELGVALDGQGRRFTGVDRGEFDQGQHDGVHEVMAVSTAGMLVRRDVWNHTGGLDERFGLFRDDVDFGWRVHAAGHRVIAVSDALVYHAEAAARGGRPSPVAPRRLDRRNAMWALLANLPARHAFGSLLRLLFGSLLRVTLLALAKKPMALRDEVDAVKDVVSAPLKLRALRSGRTEGRARVYRSVRRFQPQWVTLRRLAERLGALIAPTEYGLDPVEAEEEHIPLRERSFGVIRRILAHPSAVVLLVLSCVAFLAERSLLGSQGQLGGGALVPAWGSTGDLWATYWAGWHPVGLGSADASPPYLPFLAALSVLTLGKPSLAVMAVLVGCVPLAGLTAYLAAKRLIPTSLPAGKRTARLLRRSRVPASAIRVWAAIAYAVLPVVTGAIASGRVGTCVVYVLLPLIGLLGARVLREPRGRVDARQARRAAWGLALLLTVAMAFVPLTWLLLLILGGLSYLGSKIVSGIDLAIALAVPPLLLLPTTLQLLAHPSRFLLEVGLHRPDLVDQSLTGLSILTLDPGGPGTDLGWATAGLLALAVAALPLRSRRTAVMGGWMLILFGFLAAIAVSAVVVTEAPGEGAPGWPGVPLAFATGGLILAACAGLQRSVELVSTGTWKYRFGAAGAVLIAVSTPALAALAWIGIGVDGPVGKTQKEALPAFVTAVNAETRARTLVLDHDGGDAIAYSLLRGPSPAFGDEDFKPEDKTARRLARLVADLAAGRGTEGLNHFGVQFVYLQFTQEGRERPESAERLLRRLDGLPGLTRLSRSHDFAVWRLTEPGARLMLVGEGGAITPLRSGAVEARVDLPAGEAGRKVVLAESAGGWEASVGGKAAKAVTVDGWAAGWDVPESGGTFVLERGERLWTAWSIVQGVLFLLVVVLALPGGEAPVRGRRGRRLGRRRGAAAAWVPEQRFEGTSETVSAEPSEPVGAQP
ncbi:glycosyltransferase family 2 protein [Actinocorallia sp. A-T 12471]|uniref:glycosyltransferase family 2 protein n=1 Tax=Actinocorallia sp. A-T 12471 TaxID=3089813 RepID=UPI0029D39F3A|nr:glycosyltransferase family 2 protein [Actinocorallia sp. A-T 12471]MDX6744612.1 glycosyltransferase family 2 protein [Actinocorallia sp. A-T 12471]